jgi:hypothetical protein
MGNAHVAKCKRTFLLLPSAAKRTSVRHPAEGHTHMGDLALTDRQPSWLELERIIMLDEVAKLTSLSVDTLERHYSDRIVHPSPRRRGMKLRNALAITGKWEASERNRSEANNDCLIVASPPPGKAVPPQE